MQPEPLEQVVRNVDARLTRVEQMLPTLATKEEVRAEVREEGERTRQHFDVVAERLEGHITLLAEGHVALREDMRDMRTDLKADIAQLDRRVMRLEADRLKQTRSPET